MTYESWMNERFFENILTNFFQTEVEVQGIEIEPCGAAGEGLMSTMLRVQVIYLAEYERKSDTFVIKLPSTQKVALEKVGKQGYDVHNKELMFYELAAPRILEVLTTINESHSLIPRTIATSRDLEVIVFEDLKARDFTIKDRLSGLDETDIRLTLKKLAKFHAASLIIHNKDPNAYQAFNAGFFCRNVDAFNYYFTSSLNLVADEVSHWEGFETYGAKLKNLQGSFVELATRCFDVLPGDFCVLNHGDLWTNNLMFKLDKNGKTEEVILIDFQFCHWGSPVLDLMHLLYTSLQEEIFDQQKIEAFVEFFYCKLKSALEKLGYDFEAFPSLQEFQIEFTRKMFYGLVYMLAVLPVMTSDDPDNDFTTHHSDDERAINFKKRMLKAPKYQRIVKKMLIAFDQKGILDQKV